MPHSHGFPATTNFSGIWLLVTIVDSGLLELGFPAANSWTEAPCPSWMLVSHESRSSGMKPCGGRILHSSIHPLATLPYQESQHPDTYCLHSQLKGAINFLPGGKGEWPYVFPMRTAHFTNKGDIFLRSMLMWIILLKHKEASVNSTRKQHFVAL